MNFKSIVAKHAQKSGTIRLAVPQAPGAVVPQAGEDQRFIENFKREMQAMGVPIASTVSTLGGLLSSLLVYGKTNAKCLKEAEKREARKHRIIDAKDRLLFFENGDDTVMM